MLLRIIGSWKYVTAFADSVIRMELLSCSEMKEAFLLHFKLTMHVNDLPDIGKSKATQQIWHKYHMALWSMYRTSIHLCIWASPLDVARRQVQILAASIQVQIAAFTRNI